jgi:GAF domain-containing protein
MRPPAKPPNETARLAALHDLAVLDTAPDEIFNDLAQIAAITLNTPIALISLVDVERQWFKAVRGLSVLELPRETSFCGHVVADSRLLVVEDATSDVRFADNPLVTGEPRIRFYAGAPLVDRDGHCMGALCVIDSSPRKMSPEQEAALTLLAKQVMRGLQLRKQALTATVVANQLRQTVERIGTLMTGLRSSS